MSVTTLELERESVEPLACPVEADGTPVAFTYQLVPYARPWPRPASDGWLEPDSSGDTPTITVSGFAAGTYRVFVKVGTLVRVAKDAAGQEQHIRIR